jgi:hypothetical protein
MVTLETYHAAMTASVALASSCVKKPGIDGGHGADVIMSCITPSFGGGIPWEKESGPRRRAGEMPSCIAASYSSGDGVNLNMAGTKVSWDMGELAGE